jgi:hypothetical protein
LEARRERRPVELVRVISQLDAYQQAAQLDSAAAWIAHQYTIQDLGHLIGLFQQCSLGPPLVDHQLDLASLNLEHFTTGSIPPGPYPAARLLAAGDGCLYVEVYADGRLIPIGHDGRPGGEMSSDLRGLRSG